MKTRAALVSPPSDWVLRVVFRCIVYPVMMIRYRSPFWADALLLGFRAVARRATSSSKRSRAAAWARSIGRATPNLVVPWR